MPTAIDFDLGTGFHAGSPDQWHGLACSLLATHNDGSGPSKMAVWPTRVDPVDGASVVFRVNWLPDDAPAPIQVERGSQVRLGNARFTLRSIRSTRAPFARLAAQQPVREARLVFETPTYFSRNGRDYVLPDPDLVFGSVLRRWNAFTPQPLRIERELSDELLSSLVVKSVTQLTTVDVEAAHGSVRSGFVGDVTFATRSRSADIQSRFAALAAAADYLGVGAQTTRGFGVVQRSERHVAAG